MTVFHKEFFFIFYLEREVGNISKIIILYLGHLIDHEIIHCSQRGTDIYGFFSLLQFYPGVHRPGRFAPLLRFPSFKIGCPNVITMLLVKDKEAGRAVTKKPPAFVLE